MMKQIITRFLRISIVAVLLSSCSTSNDILKALKIDYSPSDDKDAEIELSKSTLEKQLVSAQNREATLKEQLAALENEIDESDAAFNSQIARLKEDLQQRETALNEEIALLKKELEEKEALISVQSKVIGLLDDEDQTLQNSIKAQLRDR
jgi:chromosome segregation ATPase